MQKSGTTNLTNNTNLKRKTIRRKGGRRMRKAKTTTDVTDFTDNTDIPHAVINEMFLQFESW